jgi:sRNA-binding carbon storage regulator CsrA
MGRVLLNFPSPGDGDPAMLVLTRPPNQRIVSRMMAGLVQILNPPNRAASIGIGAPLKVPISRDKLAIAPLRLRNAMQATQGSRASSN